MDYGRARGQLDVTVVLSVRASPPWSPAHCSILSLIVRSHRRASIIHVHLIIVAQFIFIRKRFPIVLVSSLLLFVLHVVKMSTIDASSTLSHHS